MNIDPITGEKYFKPQNPENHPIYYITPKKPHLTTPTSDSPLNTRLFHPNEHSIKLNKTRKLTKLKEIFQLLDVDKDGYISKESIDYEVLPDKVYEILKPVLWALEENNETWNFEDFINESGKLMRKLTVTEKSTILGSNKKS